MLDLLLPFGRYNDSGATRDAVRGKQLCDHKQTFES